MAKKINIPTTVGTAPAAPAAPAKGATRDGVRVVSTTPHKWIYETQVRGPEDDAWTTRTTSAGDELNGDINARDGREPSLLQSVRDMRSDMETTTPEDFVGLKKGEAAPYGPGYQVRLRKYLMNKVTLATADGFTKDTFQHDRDNAQVVREPASATVPPLSKTQMSPIARRVIGTSRKPHGNTGNPKGNLGKAKGNPTTAAAAAAKRAANSGTKIPKTAAGVLGKAEPKKPAPKKPAPKKGK
jgi:hypothetical protein